MPRLIAALGLLTALLAIHPAASRANCPPVGINQTCFDRPTVNQAVTNTGFTFPAGSHVSIQANGCEQTGGSGDTWKRYVNPDPPNGNSQYHGRVGILSSVGGPTTLANSRILDIVQGAFFRVTTSSFLQVGFEDDGFGDNNYDSHDNGNNNQCAWNTTGFPVPGTFYGPFGYGGPAYILLTVNPNAVPVPAANKPAQFVAGLTTLSGSATDGDGDGLTLRFLVDGTDVSGSVGTSFNWNSGTVGDGQHSVALRASDPYSTVTSGTQSFSVDNTSPTVAITNGPSNQTFGPGSTQTWTFTGNDGPGSGLQGYACKVDNVPVTCSGPSSHSVTNLANGTHTFSVQAADNVGHGSNVDSRTYAIDATPPETTITSGPVEGASTTDTSVSFAFASSEQGSTFECRLYSDQPAPIKPDFAPCSGGSVHLQTGLAPGAYVFEVRASDALHNVDATPAVRRFNVAAPGVATTQPGTTTTTSPPPVTTTIGPAALKTMVVTMPYAYASAVKLTQLRLKHVPAGSTITITCKGRGCPAALKRGYTQRNAKGTVSLARFAHRSYKPGDKITVVVSHPGYRSATMTLRFRAGKAPVAK
jgi:hypothetical protein